MTKGYVREATWADLPILSADLRAADIAEIKAFSGNTPEGAIAGALNTLDSGGRALVACLPNGIPAAIFGVAPSVKPGVGIVWMVATNQFQSLSRQFLREGREALMDLCEGYRLIFNFTDARNSVHHRWIKWMGFTIIKRHEALGHAGLPFLEFVKIMETEHV